MTEFLVFKLGLKIFMKEEKIESDFSSLLYIFSPSIPITLLEI